MRYYKFIPVVLLIAVHACSECDCIEPSATRYFVVEASSDSFMIRTYNSHILRIADSLLALPYEDRNMLISGPIARGNDGYNYDWSWHFEANEWTFAEVAIEICDGTPQYVEDHLDEWLATVGSYCPWGSRLKREVFL